MKLVIEVPDNKLNLGLEVLQSLSLVKKVNPVSEENTELIAEIQAAVEELSFIKKSNANAIPARNLLNQL